MSRRQLFLKPHLVRSVAPCHAISHAMRGRLLRACGVNLSLSSRVEAGCTFDGSPNITIGDHSFVGAETFLEAAAAPITIGAHVYIAHRVNIITTTHEIGHHAHRASLPNVRRPVVVGDGCWIGTGATVLPGVTIGAGCVIAAGALVRGDCSPDGLYAGVPAVRRRELAVADQDADGTRTSVL